MNMKILILSACSVLILQASDGFNSEISHFAGGAVLAGGVTAVVDSYYPEYKSERGMIGFGVSTMAVLVQQSIEYGKDGNARGQLLDAASHIVGSALGAYITDEYILLPVVKDSQNDGKYVGLSVQHNF
jgi:hypothetical protein